MGEVPAQAHISGLLQIAPQIGLDVDHHQRQIIQMMQQLVAHFARDGMSLRHRQLRIDRDVQFGMEAMA